MTQEIIHQITITGPGFDETYLIPPGQTTIGRQDTNHLVFAHPLVSRVHAHLTCAPDGDDCTITDLGSTHGTQLNHQPLEANKPRTLTSGDEIEIGAFRLVYTKTVIGEPENPEVVEAKSEDEEATAVPSFPPPPAVRPEPRPVPQISKSWETARYVPIAPPPKPASRKKENQPFTPPAGLSSTRSSYMEYLPDVYHMGYNNFITRFLALLESILAPIEWNVNNFDLFLDPKTAPAGFLPWLANWFDLDFDGEWSENSQRQLLLEAHQIYPRRGTSWALRRILEIYTENKVEIDDKDEELEDLTFLVKLSISEQEANRAAIEKIINANKPAHTSYSLQFASS